MAGWRVEGALALLAAALLVPGGRGVAAPGAGWPAEGNRATRVVRAASNVTVSGWFHVVWNGEPRFMLVDDRGVAIRLVIDEPVMRALGGPRGLDRQRVTIQGQRVDEAPEVVRVLSIELGARAR